MHLSNGFKMIPPGHRKLHRYHHRHPAPFSAMILVSSLPVIVTGVPLTSSIKVSYPGPSHFYSTHRVRPWTLLTSKYSVGVWLRWCTIYCALFGITVRHRHTSSARAPTTRTTYLHITHHASLPRLPLPSTPTPDHSLRPGPCGSHLCGRCIRLGEPHPRSGEK